MYIIIIPMLLLYLIRKYQIGKIDIFKSTENIPVDLNVGLNTPTKKFPQKLNVSVGKFFFRKSV